MISYLKILGVIGTYCLEFEDDVEKTLFSQTSVIRNPRDYNYCYYPRYIQYWQPLSRIITICDVFEIGHLDNSKTLLQHYIAMLEQPSLIQNFSDFKASLDAIKTAFAMAEKQLEEKISLLNGIESRRLDEAFECYFNDCYYSTIVMAVSAIEFRLLSLMMLKSPSEKLDRLTLGDLIREYLDNKDKYGNIIPKRHLPLLEFCNTYRILSAHPKPEVVTRANATSVLYMTCSFLFDSKLKMEIKETKKEHKK